MDKELVAYLRAFPPGTMYEGSSLVITLVEINLRGQSLGKNVTQKGVNFLQKNYPNDEIIISAQLRLEYFYN